LAITLRAVVNTVRILRTCSNTSEIALSTFDVDTVRVLWAGIYAGLIWWASPLTLLIIAATADTVLEGAGLIGLSSIWIVFTDQSIFTVTGLLAPHRSFARRDTGTVKTEAVRLCVTS